MLQKSLSDLFGFLGRSLRQSFLEAAGVFPQAKNARPAPKLRTSDQVMRDLADQAKELFQVKGRLGFDVHVDRDVNGLIKGVHVMYKGPHFADPSIEIEARLNLTPKTTYPNERAFADQPEGTVFSHLAIKTAEDKKMRKRPAASARDRSFVSFDTSAGELIRFGELTLGRKLSYHRPPTRRVEQREAPRFPLILRAPPWVFMNDPATP